MTRIKSFIAKFKTRQVKHLINDSDSISFTTLTEEKEFSRRFLQPQKTDLHNLTPKSVSFYHLIRMVILLFLSLIAMAFLFLTLIFMFFHTNGEFTGSSVGHHIALKNPSTTTTLSQMCQQVAHRFDCYPEVGASQKGCEDRGCCWSAPDACAPNNTPYCFYPPGYIGYKYINITETSYGLLAYLKRDVKSPYLKDVDTVMMDVKYDSETRLHVKFTDPNHKRYEPQFPELPVVDKAASNLSYQVVINPLSTGFKIVRKENNAVIFDSSDIPNMIFSDQFLQYSAFLPSKYIYGLGEHTDNFQLNTQWKKYTMFNHDAIPTDNVNGYGSHPFYLVMENDGRSHGVLLFNSNAMDVVLQPDPAVTFRTIGGVLDFYFFLGPQPSDVISQYTELIGRPYMPPYWALGFHLCRYGYKTLNDTKEVLERNLELGIPIDTQWNDLDYMNNSNDFTYDHDKYKGLPEFVKDLHKRGMHYIPLIDPGVSAGEIHGTYPPYDEGIKFGIFVRNSTGTPFVGKVWNTKSTVWPDFTNPYTVDYWTLMLKSLHDEIPFDGAWIDMNEPSNFLSGSFDGCPKSDLETPQYLPQVDGGKLCYKTLCMSAIHNAGFHYDVHNLFGLTEAMITNFALSELRGKRPVVISRASFVGLGRFAGHWSGDVWSKWEDMQQSIPQLLSFSLFGIPLMGADICGFNGNTTEALCNRWMQLGAFYPFSRNHNTDNGIPQDPAAMGKLVVESTKKAMAVRYSLLPYLYTLFWQAHAYGETVARPLFFEYPFDNNTYNIDNIFLWGPALLIIPVLEESQTSVNPYLPKGRWYDFNSQTAYASEGAQYRIPAPLDTIPIFIREGYILPMQKPISPTPLARKSNFQLLVASDSTGNASGQLYWDDGDTLNAYEEGKYCWLKFTLTSDVLRSVVLNWGGEKPPNVTSVVVLGVKKAVEKVVVNGANSSFTYNASISLLTVDVDIYMGTPFAVSWQ